MATITRIREITGLDENAFVGKILGIVTGRIPWTKKYEMTIRSEKEQSNGLAELVVVITFHNVDNQTILALADLYRYDLTMLGTNRGVTVIPNMLSSRLSISILRDRKLETASFEKLEQLKEQKQNPDQHIATESQDIADLGGGNADEDQADVGIRLQDGADGDVEPEAEPEEVAPRAKITSAKGKK